MRRYVGCLLVFALIIFGQGCLYSAEPLPGFTVGRIPDQVSFKIDLNTYSFPLQDMGLKTSCDWDNGVFNGYRLVCADEDKLWQEVKNIADELEVPSQNASFQANAEGWLEIIPSLEGRRIEPLDIYTCLTGEGHYQEIYPLTFKATEPSILTEDLERIKPDTLWAAYETILADVPNRTENVRIASGIINGLLLAPGQEFSFNERVGPRTKERGFREAPIIAGGGFRPGVGGGVCQVSSTLYNAVKLASLEITERHPHSLKVSYVPAGSDATVYYGILDFKFLNNSDSLILLRANVVDLKLQVSIYGSSAL